MYLFVFHENVFYTAISNQKKGKVLFMSVLLDSRINGSFACIY